MYVFLIFLAHICVAFAGKNIESYQPEQVHIAYGKTVHEIVVTWTTWNKTETSAVEYGIGSLVRKKEGTARLFIDGGDEHRKQYIHKVVLSNLKPKTTYMYHCGSEVGWSPLFAFLTAPKDDDEWSPILAVFGDMGNENARSLPRLQEEVQRGVYDALLHVGDFAYDMDSNNGRFGDEFMRQIEPIASYIPYMTCPGNHEQAYNFSHYRARFSMPNGEDRMYYSFNMGPAHIISFNTEYYYFLNYGFKSVALQYKWLEEDLTEANKPENRRERPWIITMGHRPMYCSNNDRDDCAHKDDVIRTGLPFLKMFGLEKLFYDHGVNLEIWAHEHSYERLWPVYDRKVLNGSHEQPYTRPGAPVHMTIGSAGCVELVDGFNIPEEWSAFRSIDYGYSRLHIHNKTHITIEQVSDDKEGEVIDRITIIEDSHGSFEGRNHKK